MAVAMDARSIIIEDETRRSIHDHPAGLQDDQFTVADTASTSYSVQSNYTTGTVGSYIPLSRLSKHSVKLRNTSSFPSILNLYHEPIKEEELFETHAAKNRSPRRYHDNKKTYKGNKRKDADVGIDSRSKQEMLDSQADNRHQQRAIRIEAVARDQIEKYEKYIANLKEKVDKQREQRKKHFEELQERLKLQAEEEKKHKYQLKRPKRDYVHDRKYLKKLPQSKFCKMVRLSDDLSKRGVLKNRSDVEHFWQDFGKHAVNKGDIFTEDPLTEVHLSNAYLGKKATLAPLDVSRSGNHGHDKQKKKQNPSDFDPSSVPSIEIQE